MKRILLTGLSGVGKSTVTDELVARLATRTNNAYGKDPAEVARALDLIESVEPRLRRAAGHEINTEMTLSEVVAALLDIAASKGGRIGVA